ncbi:MAG: hypothetical protein ACLP0J_03430 [Solirubrobacteraceae bacterium]
MRERSPRTFVAALVIATLGLSGCATDAGLTSAALSESTSPQASTAPPASKTQLAAPPPHRQRARAAKPTSARSPRLAYSTASNDIVQPQAAPGSCHAIGTGVYSRPDPACTPGALNPVVTQATINRTICVDGWTGTVRPPQSITEQQKAARMAAYDDAGSAGDYEYDHFVPLELGGATNDPRNLWPEPGASPNPKDTVEDELHHEVCNGQISLPEAQREIVTNWVSLASPTSAPAPTVPPSAPAPARGAECTLADSYSSNYNDYDVYVHSNQPHRTVTVTDAEGRTASWHTDASGYADVYFKSGGYAPGRRIIARVGHASCPTTL